MGREIDITVKCKDEELANYWVCGRDSATAAVVDFIQNNTEGGDVLVLKYGAYKGKERTELEELLQGYADKDNLEIQKAHDAIEDLRGARSRASNMKIFGEFSDLIDATYEWIENNQDSRAERLLEYLTKATNVIESDFISKNGYLNKAANDLFNDYTIEIGYSE